MKKIVKTIFSNDSRVRRTRDFNIEIYSHDRNNAGFEFVIKNETDLSKYVPKFLFHFLDSRSYWETQGTIEGNKVSVKFDTELITRSEEVLGYLTLDSETDDIDAFKFRFNVVLSEIDKDSTVKKEFRFIKDSVVIDAVTTKELEDVKSKLAERITTLENKADNDTIYDDTDLKNRVKSLEDKPDVDISKLATKEAVDDVAAKVTQLENRPVTSSYDDSEIKRKIKELEDRPTTANIDTSNFVTKEKIDNLATRDELNELEQTYMPRGMVEVTDGKAIPDYAKENLDNERVNNGEYLGRLFNNSKSITRVLKKKNGDEFEFVYFEGAMITLANVLPKDYDYQAFNDPEERVTLLTDRNFKEMVATPEFKAVVKDSLRDIVKEIIKEEN